MLSLCACKNEGNIGPLFGTWALTDITVNGEKPADFIKGQTTWSFQNNIVRIVFDLGPSEYDARVGSWEKTASEGHKYLEFNFTHSQDGVEPGTGPYLAPEWLGWPTNRIIRLEYVKDSSREMVLTWMSDGGDSFTYTLKKTW